MSFTTVVSSKAKNKIFAASYFTFNSAFAIFNKEIASAREALSASDFVVVYANYAV